jgi:hypothetical protein
MRHRRVQTVPMATPVRFDILADNPGLDEQRRAPPQGREDRAQPGAALRSGFGACDDHRSCEREQSRHAFRFWV